jgi:hypothetical protein
VSPGETFDMVRVKLSEARLKGLQYFEKVELRPDDTDIPGRKNLIVGVEEKNTGNIMFRALRFDQLWNFPEGQRPEKLIGWPWERWPPWLPRLPCRSSRRLRPAHGGNKPCCSSASFALPFGSVRALGGNHPEVP